MALVHAVERARAMSELIAVTYPDSHTAAEALTALQQLRSDELVDLEDAVYVTMDAAHNMVIHHSFTPAADSAQSSRLLVWLIGVLVRLPGMVTGSVTVEFAATATDNNASQAPSARRRTRLHTERTVPPHSARLRYRTYLLRVWEDRGQQPSHVEYRLSLEDAHTHQRRGFDSPEKLLAHLNGLIGEMRLEHRKTAE
jgi:hypothetical protein